MEKTYREIGIETYGDKCEICGHSSIEVHHIGYQEHQEIEDRIRRAVRNKEDISDLLEEAKDLGFLSWDSYSRQLDKDNSSKNLSVLCGNCHTFIHKMDVGMKLIKALKPRK